MPKLKVEKALDKLKKVKLDKNGKEISAKLGKRGKDKKPRIFKKASYDVNYWLATLKMVAGRLDEYLEGEEVLEYYANLVTGSGRHQKLTPHDISKRGIEYFHFVLEMNGSMTVYGLALHLGVDVATLMRMERNTKDKQNYVTGVYRPIVKILKSLVGLFHETMGNDKINPNFNMFVLKALRNGFEERVEVEVSAPEGLSMEAREKLRKKVAGFSESFTAKKQIAPVSTLTYGKENV